MPSQSADNAATSDKVSPDYAFAFEDSRRLTGANLYFDEPGAALETHGVAADARALSGWRRNLADARDALHWSEGRIVVREHASGASLAFVAPIDQLYAATEVNEWAWTDAAGAIGQSALPPHAPGHAAWWDRGDALRTLRALAEAEARPDLIELLEQARIHGLPAYSDDDAVSIGEGAGSQTWPLDALPGSTQVPWPRLHAIPTAVVTGSNGKTTSVRLLAAMARAQGWITAYSSTDGLFVDGERVDSGDYSGPVGARTLLRQPTVQAAILETARGGMLRRGVTPQQARAALVTNISPDHFGEYGIHSLEDLAQVKLTVARALADDGVLVLNADDALLLKRGASLPHPLAWFALDDAHPRLRAHRERGGATCGVGDGRLWLSLGEARHDLGEVEALPLTLGGRARYNVANLAGAALAAAALGVDPARIAAVLARFGSQPGDNPGRLQRWSFGASEVYLDYAHNPDGLRGLLEVAARRDGRLGIVLGQAGNREDEDIRALAAVVASFRPDRVVLKDIESFLRGRAPGEVAAILRAELLRLGVPESAIALCLEEARAAAELLQWAAEGDVLVLPIHNSDARDAVVALLDRLQLGQWRPGLPLAGDTTGETE
ncbi:Mur ligase family protein [Lysobacter sp. ISL-50]|uniref:Mur ligase family protein n=1 Tax=unclassified Lysobacter TaxID=2635362 RepID=UPI001BE7ABE4|nr:Mur ligase [Lysobacter sp. ISL-42]MBT2751017.1 Mur ligase [Lysobacter sp. ISL-50]MBT2779158.1 Mur ligase [Lysobacter sp. ISL-54]MBT2782792.1 Mur ligase [Lysobacter sp. ISL-52]